MRTFLSKTKEAQGAMPPMGVKGIIEDIEKGETGENAATPGCLMYTANLRVTEPEQYKGATLKDWFTIGTKEDRKGKREETWRRVEAGPGRLVRLLKRSGTAMTDDDEEWMEAAEGAEVCWTVTTRRDENGELRNRVGKYFRETDADFVGVGELTDAEMNGAGAQGRARRQAKPVGVTNARAGAKAMAAANTDDDEDDAPPPSARKATAKAKEPEPDEDEEKDDDDEEEEPKPKKGKVKAKAKPARDDDEDDDED